MSVTERKALARQQVRAARRARCTPADPSIRRADARALAEHGLTWLTELEHRLGKRVTWVTAYEEMATEPPVAELVQALVDRGVRVLVPVTLADGVLRWRESDPDRRDNPLAPQSSPDPHTSTPRVSGEPSQTSGDSTQSSWGSESLHLVDVAFIPALAVGADGARLGQGGGYYDRAIPILRAARPQTPVVAVVYDEEVGRDVPAMEHDISVDAALTPSGVRDLP